MIPTKRKSDGSSHLMDCKRQKDHTRKKAKSVGVKNKARGVAILRAALKSAIKH